ncbi:Xylose isomerase domain protein TIM barrel [Xenorhabdus bovienii str. kraussei Becker Underwood]|uniref:Xylose isomerase domain protein TIM barrel n=2 Tax=Xenorhabdus bovienii TaxID=40576 RepID=A0A077Q1M6_XENBV|nr:Xylose isomerase domain protein TIM barrel [Xenorhabdus bovienii str. kraussei Becker Underwood]
MIINHPELLASYWTIAGDIYPLGPNEISPFSFADRIEAAANAGFKGVGLLHNDVMSTVDKIGYAEMVRVLEHNDIKHIHLEYLVDWYSNGDKRRNSDKVRHELLVASQELGVSIIKIGPGIGEETADIDTMSEEFYKLSRQATEHGASIALEIAPYSNVHSIDTALQIVQNANESKGGILLDIWHLSRGKIDFSAIAKIPAHFITSIELSDADKYPVEPLWVDTTLRRQLPGEGNIDITSFILAVQAAGYNGPWGVEILSETYRKLPLDVMSSRAFNATIMQFEITNNLSFSSLKR